MIRGGTGYGYTARSICVRCPSCGWEGTRQYDPDGEGFGACKSCQTPVVKRSVISRGAVQVRRDRTRVA